jgi:hypothetical protein
MKTVTLDIERKWGAQRTTMTIYGQGEDEQGNVLRVSTSLPDVLKSIKEEIDSVTWVFTKKEFDKRFDAAVSKVLKDIGKATKSYANDIPK